MYMREYFKYRSLFKGASLAVIAMAISVGDQAVAQVDKVDEIEEVVVTARKKSENLYNVPISISVTSEDDINKLGAHDFTDLISSIPSLGAYQNGPGRTRLTLRGINSTSSSNGNDNETQNSETVGIYLDEIPISMATLSPEIGLFDASRVEVLRGPQGTLYGAGSMAGTLRIVTNKPNAEEFEGKIDLTGSMTDYSDEFSHSIKGLVNIPIVTGKAAIRISAYNSHGGGYIDNVLTGEQDINSNLSRGGRIALRLTPNDRFTVDASVLYHDYSDNGRPEDTDTTPLYSRDYTSFDGFDDEMFIYNLTLDYDMGNVNLVSSTSVFDRSVFNRRSIDTFYGLPGILPEGVSPYELEDTQDVSAFVEELRMSSQTDSNLQWTVGAYFDNKTINGVNSWPVPGLDAGAVNDDAFEPSAHWGAPDDYFLWSTSKQKVETYAFFGEAYYSIGDVTLTGGLRYFNWKQTLSGAESGQLLGNAGPEVLSTQPLATENGFNPKVNISWQVSDDLMLYTQAAKGFRYGGTNTGEVPADLCGIEAEEASKSGSDPRFFRPDKLWNYEVGVKGQSANKKIGFNVAAFYIDWSDMQNSRRFECGFSFRSNVGKASSKGVEVEFHVDLTDQLTWTFGGAYTDAKLDETVESLTAFRDDAIPYSPKLAFSGSLDYNWAISDEYEGFAWVNAQYVGERGSEFSTTNANYRVVDDYVLANVRIGYRYGAHEVSLFVNNALKSTAVLRQQRRYPFDPDAALRATPRTIGINLRSRF